MAQRIRVVETSARIIAVKLVRELSGLGLKESLDLVDGKAWFAVERDLATLRRIAAEGSGAGVRFEFDPALGGSASASTSAGMSTSSGTGEFTIRYRSGPNKIGAIKLVRESVAMLGLKEAKDLVESEGVLPIALERWKIEALVERFTAIGSLVEIVRAAGGAGSSSSTPSIPAPRPGVADGVYGYASDDDDF